MRGGGSDLDLAERHACPADNELDLAAVGQRRHGQRLDRPLAALVGREAAAMIALRPELERLQSLGLRPVG